jgi:hypothetical protein
MNPKIALAIRLAVGLAPCALGTAIGVATGSPAFPLVGMILGLFAYREATKRLA